MNNKKKITKILQKIYPIIRKDLKKLTEFFYKNPECFSHFILYRHVVPKQKTPESYPLFENKLEEVLKKIEHKIPKDYTIHIHSVEKQYEMFYITEGFTGGIKAHIGIKNVKTGEEACVNHNGFLSNPGATQNTYGRILVSGEFKPGKVNFLGFFK